MRSNYRRIGDFIQQVKVKNKDGACDLLLGINIDKYFMPSVANVVGTDLTKYKIIQKNQFACNRMHVGRDNRIPLALSKNSNPFIVSPAYTVFEITNTSELHPEYLMMWFSRAEFDREAWFHTDADVRGGLPWNLFCDIELPVPSIEKQREIVKEYNTIVNRIKLNEQLNQKLEETAQALYKYWFVDFEFTNKNGQPYKSSGGSMVYNVELDQEIPMGWKASELEGLINYKKGNAFKSKDYVLEGTPIVRVSDLTANSVDYSNCLYVNDETAALNKDFTLFPNDIIITSVGSWPSNPDSVVGKVVKVPNSDNTSLLNQNMVRLRAKEKALQLILFTALAGKEFSDYVVSGAQGSANQASVTLKHLFSYKLSIPDNNTLEQFSSIFSKLYSLKSAKEKESIQLKLMLTMLLSKMSKVESPKTEQVL